VICVIFHCFFPRGQSSALRCDCHLLTAGVVGAEPLVTSVFGKFQIVGYFIAVRMDAR
jgi:hypothetical protein